MSNQRTKVPEEIERRIENALSLVSPDVALLDLLATEVQSVVRDTPSLGSRLGPQIAKLRQAAQQTQLPNYDWVEVNSGFLAIGHRPEVDSIRAMSNRGVTHV